MNLTLGKSYLYSKLSLNFRHRILTHTVHEAVDLDHPNQNLWKATKSPMDIQITNHKRFQTLQGRRKRTDLAHNVLGCLRASQGTISIFISEYWWQWWLHLRDLWDTIKKTNIGIMEVHEGTENLCEERMAKNFTNLRKEMYIQIYYLEVRWTQSLPTRHII